ncbi:MAG: hypothetical protein GF313_11555, partial [Caldithrix sp.]|nr:hypothetical protein [Caldithrix sp.]
DQPFAFISAGTDGTDGPTDAAGAMVTPALIQRVHKQHLNAYGFLNNNDAYTFFEETDGLLKTGPTGTNVMDIIIGVFPPAD